MRDSAPQIDRVDLGERGEERGEELHQAPEVRAELG
jgi:hypothetical protein